MSTGNRPWPLSGAEFKRHAQVYQEIRDLTGDLGGKCQNI